jgi:stress response protein YsnF
MITREQIPQVVGHPVHDAEGKKIGDAKHMYLDDGTGNPEWVTVKTGLFGGNESFVPIRAARVVDDHLEVPYPKEQVKGAPNVDVDGGGHLSAAEEQHLYRYYGLEHRGGTDTAAAGTAGAAAGRTGGRHAAATESTGDIGTDIGRSAGVAGTAGAAGTAGSGNREMRGTAAAGRTGGSAGAGGTGGADFAVGRTGAAEALGTDTGKSGAEALTRSEEEMHVRVERRASGRARLHKYVEVEEVDRTVPIRHEEVRLEREPITAADREALRSGTGIGEEERVVTLHEESPVVETEVVAKERVRMRVEEHTEQQKVHGRVRKERIEADMQGPTDPGPTGREGDPSRRDPRER